MPAATPEPAFRTSAKLLVLLVPTAMLVVALYALTVRHDAQLAAQAEAHNAQLLEQTATHNRQLVQQAGEHDARLKAR